MSHLHCRKPFSREQVSHLATYEHYVQRTKVVNGTKIPFNALATKEEQLKELQTNLVGDPETLDGGFVPEPSYLDPLQASSHADTYAQNLESLIMNNND